MIYKVNSVEWGYYKAYTHTTLDPEDFLEYEDIESLLDAVQEFIDYNSECEIGEDVSLEEVDDRDYNIPDEFVKEWCKLKNIPYEG